MKTKQKFSKSLRRKGRSEGGFGLAEVLLASGVLILVVASIVSLSRFVIRGYSLTASRVQAHYLAQEGLEIVRNVRDSSWIDACITTDFSSLPIFGSGGTAWTSPNIPSCSLTPRYVVTPNADEITLGGITFRRSLLIETLPQGSLNLGNPDLNSNTKHVVVTVSWDEGGRDWTVTAETYLTNWKIES